MLNQEDLGLIARITLGWSIVYNLIIKMTPEQYADKIFLNGTKSKRKLATVHLMFDAIREGSDPLVTPKEFNEKLAREMSDKSVNDLSDLTIEAGGGVRLSQYLTPPEINFVLETLMDIGILDNIIGKEAIKHELNRMPGKSKKDEVTFVERFGGRPSAYKKSEAMNKLSKLLQSNPQARDLVYKTLKDSGILLNYETFVLSALYLALRNSGEIDITKNESIAQKILRATGDEHVDESKIKSFREQLLKLNPDQIKQFAAERAKIAVERRKDDANFLLGLFRM